jgi:uncharacterized cupredoxin-like copper-binding protein
VKSLRVASLAVVALLLAVGAAVVAFAGAEPEKPVTQAAVRIQFSKFEPGRITVPAGVPVTFTLTNDDPIEHEWIVGDDATHERHRTGTEPYHDQVPTEVTLRAYETKTTVIVFDSPGDFRYVCHLPGHEEYGMTGIVHVVK